MENDVKEEIRNIRNVVFDLGGVVIDLARENAVRELELLGLSDAGELLTLYRQEEPFLSLETGLRTAPEVLDILRKKCIPGTSDSDIAEAFEAFLVRIPRERLAAIRRLRESGYRVYALSNTNPIMFHGWINRAFMQEGLKIRDYFDGIVTSFEEGTCKPDKEIFQTVLTRYGLTKDETLMLDDSDANCKAAREVGMKAFRIDNSMEERAMIAVVDHLINNSEDDH